MLFAINCSVKCEINFFSLAKETCTLYSRVISFSFSFISSTSNDSNNNAFSRSWVHRKDTKRSTQAKLCCKKWPANCLCPLQTKRVKIKAKAVRTKRGHTERDRKDQSNSWVAWTDSEQQKEQQKQNKMLLCPWSAARCTIGPLDQNNLSHI